MRHRSYCAEIRLQILYKMNWSAGLVNVYRRSHLVNMPPAAGAFQWLDMRLLSDRMLKRFCILCGCDTFHRIKHLGIKSAFELVVELPDEYDDRLVSACA